MCCLLIGQLGRSPSFVSVINQSFIKMLATAAGLSAALINKAVSSRNPRLIGFNI